MMRAFQSLLAALAISAVLMGLAIPVSAQDGGDAAFESIASCFSERGSLLVLALMDESGSLRRTDPEDRRVLALQSALTNFAGLRQLAGEGATIEVGLASFGEDFELVNGWTDLGPDTVSDLRDRARDFAGRDRGLDTDFAMALEGAQAALAQRAADLRASEGEQPCRVLLLFTDGAYDVEPRNSAETKPYAPNLPLNEPGNDLLVEEAGKERICEAGGLADALRETRVPLITLAFTTEIAPDDQTFLRAMSSGEASGTRCGEVQRPDAGVYLPADDLSDLLFAFDRATGRILTGQPLDGDEELEICPREACPEGTRQFELDASLRQAHLLANLVAPGVIVLLQGPDGSEPVRIEPNEAQRVEHSGARLTVTPLSETDVVIDAELPPADGRWVGTWSVTFIDTTGQNPGAIARTQIILFGALQPEIVGSPEFRLGETSRVSVRIVDQAGTPRTPADFVAEAAMTGIVTNPIDGTQQRIEVQGPDGSGTWSAEFTPPEDLDATALNLSVTLDVTTVSGVTLQPRTTTISVPVLPPASYPSVHPEQLELGTLVGAGSLTETIVITGGEENGGCVWFGLGAVDKPRYAGDVSLAVAPDATSETNCIRVGPGESREVEISYSADEVASGAVQAPLSVSLQSDAGSQVIERRIPVSFDMLRPVNQAKRLGLFLAFLLPGLLLPFVLMYLVNWMGARFRKPGYTRHARLRTRVTAAGTLERQDAQGHWVPIHLGPRDFKTSDGPAENVRGFDAHGLDLRSHTPLNPFREPYGTARQDGSPVVASDGRVLRGQQVLGRIGFELPSTWVFVIRDVLTAEEHGDHDVPFDVVGDLHVWLEEAPFAEQGPRVLDRLREAVPVAAQHAARSFHDRGGDTSADGPDSRTTTDPGYAPPSAPERVYHPPGAGSQVPPSSPATQHDVGRGDVAAEQTRKGYEPPSADGSGSPETRQTDLDGETPRWRPPST